MTQEGLAELLDLPVQHVSRIEAGQNITLETLERIATALGSTVSITFLPTAEGPKKPPPSSRQRKKDARKAG
jgi:transcriptional regulator with XRE-family HTH domain